MRKEMGGWIWATQVAMLLTIPGTAGAAPAAAPAAKPAAPQTFACEIGVRSSTYGMVDSSKLWMKGTYLRWEKRSGAGLRILLLRNAKGVYQINQASHDGHKWPKDWEKELSPRVNLVGGPQGDPWVFLQKVKAKRTGAETYNGRPCEIWSYTVPGQKKGERQIFRVWMAKPAGTPLKLETRLHTPRGSWNTVGIEYKSYRWGMPLSDSFFDVPRGTKIVDLGKSGSSLPQPRPASLKATPSAQAGR
jgi:hypothetical protein